jgi:hypothetical protein
VGFGFLFNLRKDRNGKFILGGLGMKMQDITIQAPEKLAEEIERQRAQIVVLEALNQRYRQGLQSIISQNQQRGYPLGREWEKIVSEIRETLR